MVRKLVLEAKKVVWGKFSTTIFCYVSELPICSKCGNQINNNTYAYICDNKVFYCELCFDKEFLIEHRKSFKKLIHNDKLVYIQLNPNL